MVNRLSAYVVECTNHQLPATNHQNGLPKLTAF